jgi:hypothetical protein
MNTSFFLVNGKVRNFLLKYMASRWHGFRNFFQKIGGFMIYAKYQSCVEACMNCAAACSQCVSACLEEKEVSPLKECIRLNLECAAICRSAAEVMMLNGKYVEYICQLCSEICTVCAEECEKHAQMGMEHCRECAAVCRLCAEECIDVAAFA